MSERNEISGFSRSSPEAVLVRPAWHAAVAVCAAAVVLVMMLMPFWGAFLVKADRLVVADAALVFSGDPGYERTLEATRLYHLGYVRYLVFSGRGGPGDSAQSMAEVALQHGVPPTALLIERDATSTYENVLFVRGLLTRNGVRRLILVTSPYHQRRAYLVARHLLRGIALINHPVRSPYWHAHRWWQDPALRSVVFNEYQKLAGYLLLGRI